MVLRCLACLAILLWQNVVVADPAEELTYEQTRKLLRTVSGIDEELLASESTALKALSYTQLRALQSLCTTKGFSARKLPDVIRQLPHLSLSTDHLELLDTFVGLPDAALTSSMELLSLLTAQPPMAGRVLAVLPKIAGADSAHLLIWIKQVLSLRESGQWAARSFFQLPGQTADSVQGGLDAIQKMNEHQHRAADALCSVANLTATDALPIFARLQQLEENAARISRAMFSLREMNSTEASRWLSEYMILSPTQMEQNFAQLSKKQKMQLLLAYSGSAQDFLWKINNLHDITDDLGQEIGNRSLSSMSYTELSRLFQRLDSTTRARFAAQIENAQRASNKALVISELRQATAQARRQAARDLTSANIYVLLARGSELYDSSFRDILVPVLHDRMATQFAGTLLSFLTATDPSGVFVADFITNLAQKGKLLTFLPGDSGQQRDILQLVAQSALTQQSSLLLFSATFQRLLENLQPESRSYLIQLMLAKIHTQPGLLADQIKLILQYYLDVRPKLLPGREQEQIASLLAATGRIKTEPYITTPFSEWKKDGLLASLSVFQQDDDGRESFLSNCANLLDHGYSPRLSTLYAALAAAPVETRQLSLIFSRPTSQQRQELAQIYQASAEHAVVIDWLKMVNGIQVVHSTCVYQGEQRQKELLQVFIKNKYEMFAQRGHSYWRQEQLIAPLTLLIKEGKITRQDLTAMPRFLSLGSCGGIRVYSELNRLFYNSVDILATVGTGKTAINNPYNQQFLEIIAQKGTFLTWQDVVDSSAEIFARNLGEDYLQPGSLPAILHKMTDLDADGPH